MGKLIKNKNGTHTFKGGFSTKSKDDMKQVSAIVKKKMLKPKKTK